MSEGGTSGIFDSLPGQEVPVGKVAQSLEAIWSGGPEDGGPAPSEFRASQMNLVLHLGMRTTLESAKVQFDNALALSRRHPARTVVLCPLKQGEPGDAMRAKIFSECFIGKSRTEMICCEVVMLSYPFETRRYLENQVSICLEADLPLYYWPHCIASGSRLEDYSYLLSGARRIVIDSACENAGVAEALSPFSEKVRDLADARLQRVRQSLGRFLSGFPPESLVRDLAGVTVRHDPVFRAEGVRLLGWAKKSLLLCSDKAIPDSLFSALPNEAEDASALSLEFEYSDDKRSLRWDADFEAGRAHVTGDLGSGAISAQSPVSLLKPEVSLAEALFF